MVRRGYSDERWREWIRGQAESGLSIAAYCEWIGVSQNAFYVRRRRLEARVADSGAAKAGVADSGIAGRLSFVPVAVVRASVVEIELPCGAVIRVPDEEPVLRRVLGLLLEAEPSGADPGEDSARVRHHASAGGHRHASGSVHRHASVGGRLR
jgi:hypothetical protein